MSFKKPSVICGPRFIGSYWCVYCVRIDSVVLVVVQQHASVLKISSCGRQREMLTLIERKEGGPVRQDRGTELRRQPVLARGPVPRCTRPCTPPVVNGCRWFSPENGLSLFIGGSVCVKKP